MFFRRGFLWWAPGDRCQHEGGGCDVMAVATPSKYTSTGGEDALKKYATYIVLSVIKLY